MQSHERLDCCGFFDWLSPFHRVMVRAERTMFASRRLRAVICSSEMVKDEVIRHCGAAEDKLHVKHNGVDPEQFHPRLGKSHRAAARQAWRLPSEGTVFLFVGSGYERKGLDTLLTAMAMSRAPAHLVVISRDKYQANYERQARRLGIADRVRFVGPVSNFEAAYGCADALVLPTLYDPLPNVVVEALACGLPVVISTKCGAIDVIKKGTNGFICDALDAGHLANHLDALDEEDGRIAMKKAARTTAESLTLDIAMEHRLSVYLALHSAE